MVSGALGEGAAGAGDDVEILQLATSVAEFVFNHGGDVVEDQVASLNIFRTALGLGVGSINWGPAKSDLIGSSFEEEDAEEEDDEEAGGRSCSKGRKNLSRRAWYKRRKKAKIAAQFVLSQVLEGVDRHIDRQQEEENRHHHHQQQHYHYHPALSMHWFNKAPAAAPVCWGAGGSLAVEPPAPSPMLRRVWRESD